MDMNAKFSADAGACLRRGWELYKKQWTILSAATFLMGILMALVGFIPFGGLLVAGPLLGGIYILIIKIDKGEDFTFANYFDGFQSFVPLLAATTLTGLFIFFGYMLLIIPGIYLTLAYAFTTLNIVDGGMEFWPAMEKSRKDVTAHFWDYLMLALIMLAITVVSAIPTFGFGVIFTLPVCLAAQYYFYKDMREFYAGDKSILESTAPNTE